MIYLFWWLHDVVYVLRFAGAMIYKLWVNRHKQDFGSWRHCRANWMIDRCNDELLELEGAVFGGGTRKQTIHEAADVANFAMFIAFAERSNP